MARRRVLWMGLLAGLLIVGFADVASALAQTSAPPSSPSSPASRVSTPAETLSIGAWLQPVWQYRGESADDDQQGFFLRRARLDVRGSLLDGRILFRILPDFARSPELRDSWVEVRGAGGLSLRMGQQTVPFDLQRDFSMGAGHFGERALAARRFEVQGGRDVGAVVRWRSPQGRAGIQVGAFNGEGANRGDLGVRPLFSTRATLSLGGGASRTESARGARSETPVVTLGVGAMHSERSFLRPRPGFASDRRVDWWGASADAHVRWQGVSGWGALYRQEIRAPEGGSDVRFVEFGQGWIVSAGWTLPGERLEVVARASESTWDRRRDPTPEREVGFGVTFFHVGHEVQSRLQFTREQTPRGALIRSANVLTLEHQLLLGGL
jgi:hypothetical protein